MPTGPEKYVCSGRAETEATLQSSSAVSLGESRYITVFQIWAPLKTCSCLDAQLRPAESDSLSWGLGISD